jgi:ubiquinone biosynthesis protein
VLRQLFTFGFFQGDPHPGNILIRDDNTIAFVDFGIYGELTDQHRENLAGFFENIALGNIDQAFRYYARQHTPTGDTDIKEFERVGKSIMRLWYHTSMNPFTTPKERHMGRFAVKMIEVVRDHRLHTDPDTVLLWRALYALHSSSERLSDYFDMMAQIRAFFIEERPGALQRVATMMSDRQRTMTVFRLSAQAAGSAENLLGDLSDYKLQLRTQTNESKTLRGQSDRRSLSVTQAVVFLSLATTAVLVPIGIVYRAVALVLALLIFAVVVMQTRAHD